MRLYTALMGKSLDGFTPMDPCVVTVVVCEIEKIGRIENKVEPCKKNG